ncbi:MAG: alpha/beta hydrolase [bacterium]
MYKSQRVTRWLSVGLLLGLASGSTPWSHALSPVGLKTGPPPLAMEVAFNVVNTNTSLLRCPPAPDGFDYQLRGDLILPRMGASSVTVYVHGASGNHWRYGPADGVDDVYDFPVKMARRGHASLVLDLLGYGRSGKPDGNAMCMGSQADVLHQVVQKLREGDYATEYKRTPAFDGVVIAGHSSGGWMAEVEAYSFRDIDGLIMLESADVWPSWGWAVDPVTNVALTCAQGGIEGRPNYSYSWSSPEALAKDMFYDVDPAIPPAFMRRIEPDPCLERGSIALALTLNQALIETVDVPVLVVHGERSMAMSAPAGEIQCARYVSSPGCTFVRIPNTGHILHLERSAPVLHDVLSGWLDTSIAGRSG